MFEFRDALTQSINNSSRCFADDGKSLHDILRTALLSIHSNRFHRKEITLWRSRQAPR